MATDIHAFVACATELIQTSDEVQFFPAFGQELPADPRIALISDRVRDPEVVLLGVLPRHAGLELLGYIPVATALSGSDVAAGYTIPQAAFVVRGASRIWVDLASCAPVDVDVTKTEVMVVGAPGGRVWAEAAVAGCGVATTTDLEGRVERPRLPIACTLAVSCGLGQTEVKLVRLDPASRGRIEVGLNAPERPEQRWDAKSIEALTGLTNVTVLKTCGSRMPSAPR